MSDIAGIAGNAVSVYQQALTTVSNNIANVATEGYSRQDVKLGALPVTLTGGVFLGSGVGLDRVQRQYNEFVERNLRTTVSDLASQEPMLSYANRVVDIMGGQSMGLNSALDRFFQSARALSGDASSTVMRGSFLREAEGIAERFGQLTAQLDLVELETRQSMDSSVTQINELAANLAMVNKQLTKQKTLDAQPADLLDQRDLLLKKLSNFARVNTEFTPNGTVTVSLGATINQDVLVRGNNSLMLSANYDSTAADKVVLVLDPYGQPRSLSGITSGSLAGLMSFREQVLGSTRNALDGLAKTFVKEANTIHQQGVDGYGNPGQALFKIDPKAAYAAGSIQVTFADSMQIASAAQFRVVKGATNPSESIASISYLDSPLTPQRGPADITTALVNGAYTSNVKNINVSLSFPVAGVAAVANEEKILKYMTLTAEPGVIGGMPASGVNFGAATNPDAVVVWAGVPQTIVALKNMQQLGLKTQIYGGVPMSTGQVPAAAGDAVEGAITPDAIDRTQPNPAHLAYNVKYRKLFGKDPANTYGMAAYDAVKLIAEALKGSNGDGAKVMANGEKIRNYQGLMGNYSYSRKEREGLGSSSVVWHQYKGGKLELLK